MNTSAHAALRPIAIVVATAGLAISVLPGIASADPAQCRASVVGSTSSTGLLKAVGYGSCRGKATRTLRVEIKHDFRFTPDALLAASSHYRTGYNYRRTVTSCDHGSVAKYYGRSFFTVSRTFHDTRSTRQHTC